VYKLECLVIWNPMSGATGQPHYITGALFKDLPDHST
jgi:hypothetical protein